MSQKLEFYALQDNVTDPDQVIPVSFTVISDDSDYNGMSLPTVNVTVVKCGCVCSFGSIISERHTGQLNWDKQYTDLGQADY